MPCMWRIRNIPPRPRHVCAGGGTAGLTRWRHSRRSRLVSASPRAHPLAAFTVPGRTPPGQHQSYTCAHRHPFFWICVLHAAICSNYPERSSWPSCRRRTKQVSQPPPFRQAGRLCLSIDTSCGSASSPPVALEIWLNERAHWLNIDNPHCCPAIFS